jgi:hypothetical protein
LRRRTILHSDWLRRQRQPVLRDYRRRLRQCTGLRLQLS